MTLTIPIKLDGDHRLFGAMGSSAVRQLVTRLRESTVLRAGDFRALERTRSDALRAKHPAAVWRGASLRTSRDHGNGYEVDVRSRLDHASREHILRTIEARVFARRWRLHPDEGSLASTSLEGNRVLLLFAHCFVLSPIAPRELFRGGPRDIAVLRADREWELLRFEGVRVDPARASLAVMWRSRVALDRRWSAPLIEANDRRILAFYRIEAALVREGFASVQHARWWR